MPLLGHPNLQRPPNLGAAVARHFGREGMAVGLIARDEDQLAALAEPLRGGAALNPDPQRTGLGISFAGEVAYDRILHDELRDRGIHVGHTAIGGLIAPGKDRERRGEPVLFAFPAGVAQSVRAAES